MTEQANKPSADDALRDQFEASMKKRERRPSKKRRDPAGDPLLRSGKISGISGDDVFVDLGPKVQGVIHVAEFETPPEVGQEFEFSMISVQDDLWTLSRQEARKLETWQGLAVGKRVTAKAIGLNSGGLEMKIGPVAAFLPASHLDTGSVEDLQPYIGQEILCEVTEVNERRKRVVLSRKRVVMEEQRKLRKQTLATLQPGQVVRGKVEKLEKFGAFVEIGQGVTGLLHVSNISHARIEDPSSVLEAGQEVEVQVLEIKDGGKRIGLGMKQLTAHPWDVASSEFHEETITKGKVTRCTEFGAFVEVADGVEGLLHISQLGPDRVKRVEDAVNVGDEVTVRVQSIDHSRRRLSLSRLTSRGALIGSEDDIDDADFEPNDPNSTRIFRESDIPVTGTNLGDLLRKALEDK